MAEVPMSTYVISDLHGCKKEFDEMLSLIEYRKDYDTLWIDGDICDRGNESIALMQEIMKDPSMHIIYGNHDLWFQRYAQELIDTKHDNNSVDMTDDLMCWLHYNGGYKTADQFMDLSFPECYDMKLYLDSNRIFYKELTIRERKFLLVHAGLADEYLRANIRMSEVPEQVLVWSHIGRDDNPFDDTTMIVGHIPTFLYGDSSEGKILHGRNNTLYHIDCGCVYGRTLGCLRLDDMKEFYVKSSYPYLKCSKDQICEN
jgi:serine/threonine protein phosphatase 1